MKKSDDSDRVDMTPMIDVVFQLLIFFVVALKPMDELAQLNVDRPMGQDKKPPAIERVELSVTRNGYRINDRAVTASGLSAILARMAHFGTNQTVLVFCDPDAEHDGLVRALDLCHAAKLTKIALVSR